jgi:hypothetical protein
VLKKAGIIVAASAVSLLAVGGGVAFADGADQHGIANLQNTNAQVPVQLCNNSVAEGGLAIVGKASNKDKHDGKCKQDNKVKN